MASEYPKILLTGPPGCGKTTAIMKIVESLGCEGVVGFYTQEIRQNNTRKGFSWNGLDGARGVLAHVDIKSRFKVGKYGVDVAGFEAAVVSVLDAERTGARLFVIDEVGKMECFSKKFVAAVRAFFISEKAVLATVARKGSGLIAEVKSSPGVKLFNLTRENRDDTIAEVLNVLSFLNVA